ncbi:hypothetical protein KA517_03380 [Candidatus Gracilibacteria bacterium]|nr:hypothetical protein [Candidatus Gracilibacteria bacterium]
MFYPITDTKATIKNTSKVRKEQRSAKREAKQFRAWLAKPYMFSLSQ